MSFGINQSAIEYVIIKINNKFDTPRVVIVKAIISTFKHSKNESKSAGLNVIRIFFYLSSHCTKLKLTVSVNDMKIKFFTTICRHRNELDEH